MQAWHRNAVAAAALATTLAGGFEGLRHYTYADVGGVVSYCYGETTNPRPGHYYSTTECRAELTKRIVYFQKGVAACTNDIAMPAKMESAMIDAAYNLGLGTFCRSSMAAAIRTRNFVAACNALPRYDHAAGRIVRGLTVRRDREKALCLEGIGA